ncbi:MAG TPA: cupin domain-containing protein [Pyrinomonadaceae bacterium]|nr:cupin domain-containing protein [Pyrinomonadaceae bacterium]
MNQLEKILEPCRLEDFFASVWGKSYAHFKGSPGRFKHLLSWDKLNEILRQHRLDYPRLRLMRDGETIPSSSFVRRTQSARVQGTIPRLKPLAFTKHLREGATLVLDAVSEVYPPIEELAQELELILRERIQVNMYAGWHTSRGFDLHWDDHDVFILQVTGRKRWRIYGETMKYPLTMGTAPKPTDVDNPLWEGYMEDGDVLYIPRGWWHVAFPLSEPTLHLTVGIHNRTGSDLLRWLTRSLEEREIFRQDLPRYASEAKLKAHGERLREELLSAWNDDLVERFLDEYDAARPARQYFSLPWSAMPEALPCDPDARLRFLAPRPLRITAEDGVVEFTCLSKHWRFAEDAALVLRPLNERRVCRVRELCEAATPHLDEQRVRTFLSELVREGLVAVVED